MRRKSRMLSGELLFVFLLFLSLRQGVVSTTDATSQPPLPHRDAKATPIIDLSSSEVSCNETSPCPISEALTCQDGFCKCAYPKLTYNTKKKMCEAKVGEQCGFFIGLQNGSTVGCPENSICALTNLQMVTDAQNNPYSSRTCQCVYTHYQNEGKCISLRKHGESCNGKRRCSKDSDLVCINGTCQCPFKKDQYFDSNIGKCISYAGGNCTRECVAGAICDFWGTGTCQCRLDHRINGDRQCEMIPPGYMLPCVGEKELCNTELGLKCIDKVCQCSQPLHQMYDFQQEKCIGLAGDICDPQLSDNCVRHAECVKTSESAKSVCKCKSGYTTTPFRKCMKSHKQKCFNEFCNVFRGLACISSTCQCYDSFLKYDAASETCLSPVGSPCGKVYVPFGDWMKSSYPEIDSYFFACDLNSTCTKDLAQGAEVGALEKFRCQPK